MIEVKVIHRFHDRYTGIMYEEGEVITITEDRFQEICSASPDLIIKLRDVEAVKRTRSRKKVSK